MIITDTALVAIILGVGDTDYALGRTRAEYDRLIEQAELLAPLTRRVMKAAGIEAGMSVLDIGCGVGDVSFLLSELVGAAGSVVGIDLDEDALAQAEKRRIEQGLAHVSFCYGDPRTTEFEGRFDAVAGRFVLMFMDHPVDALRNLSRHVRPGGIAAFHEWVGTVGGVSPSTHPVLSSMQELISRTFEHSGAWLDIGARLYQHMLDAGLDPAPNPLAEVAYTSDRKAAYRRWALFFPSLLPKIIEYRLGTQESVEAQLRALHDELLSSDRIAPLSYLMVGQWARTAVRPALDEIDSST